MNTPWQAVWLLAVEAAGVVVVTGLIAWRLRSVVWQRTLWQASLLALTGLLLVEFSSLNLFRASGEQSAPVASAAVPNLALSTPAVTPIERSPAAPAVEPSQPIATSSPEPFTLPELAPMPSPKELAPLDIHVEAITATTPSKDSFPLALALLLGVWAIGALVLASRLLVGRFILLRFCARSQTVFGVALFDRVQGIARKLGLKRSVQVLEAARIHTPVVFGLFRLTIALPAGFTERFDRRQQEAILAHELAHLAARDPLWYLLADGLVSVLWWHPLVWLARARLQVTSEMAADEACVLAENGPETLAECLVTIAQEISTPGSLESIGIEGSGFRSRLGQRVERLLNLSAELAQRPSAWRTRLVKLGLPVVLIGVLLLSSGWVKQEDTVNCSELPRLSWATLRSAIEIPPEDQVKRERVVLLAATKPIELAQNTQTGDKEIAASASHAESKVPVKIFRKEIQGEKMELNLATLRKLDEIIMPELFMDGLPLGPAVEYLMAESKKLDPAKIGLKITWEGNVPFSPNHDQKVLLDPLGAPIIPATALESQLDRPLDEVRILVNPELKKLNFGQVMDVVCAAAGWPLQYRIQDGVIVFSAKPKPIKGASPARKSQNDDDKATSQTNQVQVLRVPNPIIRTILAKESTPERQRILQKLDKMVIKVLFFDGRSLSEVARFLHEESVRQDPDKVGVNFTINPTLEDKSAIDLEKMTVKINPPLKHLTMAQALEAVVQVATSVDGYGLLFEVNDYAVEFRPEIKAPPQLFVRKFKIDGKIFARELESRVGGKVALLDTNTTVSDRTNVPLGAADGTNSNRLTEKLQSMAKMYFIEQGVDLSTNGTGLAATQIFYNNRTGDLLVRASLRDLETVNQALEELHLMPLEERMPNDMVVSAQGNVSFGYTFDAANYVRGLEKLTGKKLDELTVAALAGRPNAGKNPSVSDWRLAKWQQVDLLTEEFLSAQGADISSGKFKLITSGGGPEEGVRWVVHAGRAEREVFQKSSEKIRAAGKQDGAAIPVERATIQARTLNEAANKKLDEIVMPELFMDGLPLDKALKYLGEESQRLDPEKKGLQIDRRVTITGKIKITVDRSSTGTLPKNIEDELKRATVKVNPPKKSLSFRQVLETVCEGATVPLQYQVQNGVVIVTVMFNADKDEVVKLVEEGRRLFESKKDEEAEAKFKEVLKLDPANQVAIRYLESAQEIRLMNDVRKRDANQRARLAEAQKTGTLTNKWDLLSVPNPYVRTQAPPAPSKARLRIEELLDNTILKELFFDGLPLSEVVRFFQEESVKIDPDKRGINFIIDSKPNEQTQFNVDLLGNPIAVPKNDSVDLTRVLIYIKPPLKNLTMREALIAVTNATARVGTNSLTFSVNDYAVVFRPYIPQPPQMFVRRFKVDTDSFMRGLKKTAAASGLTSITTSTNMQDQLREFFRLAGVGTNTNSMTVSQIFFNDTTGILLVRATLEDLEVIQQTIEILNMSKAQIEIEARYIEVSDKTAKEMGLTWFTSGPLNGTNTVKMDQLINVSIPTNQNVRLDAPVLPNHVSVLSPVQAKELIQNFTKRDGVDLLTAPRVTTLHNRQAQIAVQDQMNIAVGKDKQANEIPSGKESPKKEPTFVTSPVTTGPMLDVLPKVTGDGLSLQLTWRVSLTEFVGYDKPGKGMEKDEPLPRFRVRQVANTSMLRDGQTLLLGCGMTERTVRERVPEGKLFRVGAHTEKKHVIVLLTARIVDPAGNPVNRDEELGY